MNLPPPNLPPQILPSTVTPPALLAPAADLFARRAARLRHLAGGHSMAPWLLWLANLADAQQQALNGLADSGLRQAATLDPQHPVLHTGQAALHQAWPAICASLATAVNVDLQAETSASLEQRAAACLELAAGQAVAAGRDTIDLIVAAALQVVWSGAARHLGLPASSHLESEPESCPCCGSAALGSIVRAGDGAAGLRYQECSLCATRWNAVRARCTLCTEGSRVDYLGLEGSSGAVQAETCEHCHGYIKTFFQDKDINVDPLADDLATLALDVLVGEQGYARALPNLFLGEGEAA